MSKDTVKVTAQRFFKHPDTGQLLHPGTEVDMERNKATELRAGGLIKSDELEKLAAGRAGAAEAAGNNTKTEVQVNDRREADRAQVAEQNKRSTATDHTEKTITTESLSRKTK